MMYVQNYQLKQIFLSHLQQKFNKKSKNEITNDVNSVMSEELASKIADNARLHAALDEVDKKYEDKISNLVSTIQSLEHQLSKNSQKDRAEDTKQKELIQGMNIFHCWKLLQGVQTRFEPKKLLIRPSKIHFSVIKMVSVHS